MIFNSEKHVSWFVHVRGNEVRKIRVGIFQLWLTINYMTSLS